MSFDSFGFGDNEPFINTKPNPNIQMLPATHSFTNVPDNRPQYLIDRDREDEIASVKEDKELKIITVGSKGLDQLKRIYGKYIIKKISFKDFLYVRNLH